MAYSFAYLQNSLNNYIKHKEKQIENNYDIIEKTKNSIKIYKKIADKYGDDIKFISENKIIAPNLIEKCNRVRLRNASYYDMYTYPYFYDENKIEVIGCDIVMPISQKFWFQKNSREYQITIQDYSKIFENTAIKNKDFWYKKIDNKINIYLAKVLKDSEWTLTKNSYNYEKFMDTMIFI